MANEVTAAIITGICTLAVGFFGGKALYNNLTININGQEVTIDKQDYKKLYSTLEKENEELKIQLARNDAEKQQNKSDLIENIRLVIDSVEIGNSYRGIADSGEILLSSSAIGNYVGKPVKWDAAQNTIFVGSYDKKIAKEIPLWNTPYSDIQYLQGLRGDEEKHQIGLYFTNFDHIPSSKENNIAVQENFISYTLDGKAVSVSGKFGLETNKDNLQMQFFILDQNGTELYSSPKLSTIAPEAPFKVDISGVLELKIIARQKSEYSGDTGYAYIQDLTVLTTEYD